MSTGLTTYSKILYLSNIYSRSLIPELEKAFFFEKYMPSNLLKSNIILFLSAYFFILVNILSILFIPNLFSIFLLLIAYYLHNVV